MSKLTESAIEDILPDGPVLILLDELVIYLSGLDDQGRLLRVDHPALVSLRIVWVDGLVSSVAENAAARRRSAFTLALEGRLRLVRGHGRGHLGYLGHHGDEHAAVGRGHWQGLAGYVRL